MILAYGHHVLHKLLLLSSAFFLANKLCKKNPHMKLEIKESIATSQSEHVHVNRVHHRVIPMFLSKAIF
jgi:hypothetical protein